MSYLVSSYSPASRRELRARAYAYLPSGGRLLIHDFALDDGLAGPRNTALWFFANLAISATTHAHAVGAIATALQDAGFAAVAARPIVPELTSLLVATRP